jgi:hypothetical protein
MTHRDELRRICRVEPDDGPFVRELKAVLAPDDLAAEVFYLPTREHDASVKGLNVPLQGVNLVDQRGYFGGVEEFSNAPNSRATRYLAGCHASLPLVWPRPRKLLLRGGIYLGLAGLILVRASDDTALIWGTIPSTERATQEIRRGS